MTQPQANLKLTPSLIPKMKQFYATLEDNDFESKYAIEQILATACTEARTVALPFDTVLAFNEFILD